LENSKNAPLLLAGLFNCTKISTGTEYIIILGANTKSASYIGQIWDIALLYNICASYSFKVLRRKKR